MNTKSKFLLDLHYFFGQTDGTYSIPNSSVGDLLKRAKLEIETLLQPPPHKNWINSDTVTLYNILLSDDADNDSKRSIISELNYRAFNMGYKFGKTNSEMIDESYTNKFY